MGDTTRVSLLFANKTPGDILLKGELDELNAAHPNLSVHYTVDRAPPPGGAAGAAGAGGRGLHSSTSQVNLSRFGHTSHVPLSNRLGENHAPNVSHKMCLR